LTRALCDAANAEETKFFKWMVGAEVEEASKYNFINRQIAFFIAQTCKEEAAATNMLRWPSYIFTGKVKAR
jgi:hypothetical protein